MEKTDSLSKINFKKKKGNQSTNYPGAVLQNGHYIVVIDVNHNKHIVVVVYNNMAKEDITFWVTLGITTFIMFCVFYHMIRYCCTAHVRPVDDILEPVAPV